VAPALRADFEPQARRRNKLRRCLPDGSVVISIFGARLCAQHQSQQVSQALRLVFDTAALHQIKALPFPIARLTVGRFCL